MSTSLIVHLTGTVSSLESEIVRAWEITYGYGASIDAIENALKVADLLSHRSGENILQCKFVINAGSASEIKLRECFLSEAHGEINAALTALTLAEQIVSRRAHEVITTH